MCVVSWCNISNLLSAVEMSHTTQTALALAWWPSSEITSIHVRVSLRILAVATIQWRHLLWSELPIVRLLFEGGVYSKEIWYTHTHRSTYSQSLVLTWHGTVSPIIMPYRLLLRSGTKYGMPWGLARTADWICSAARFTAACQWIRSLKGVITNSKSPVNLAASILITMPVLAHIPWVGVKLEGIYLGTIYEQSMNHVSLNKKGRPRCYGKSTTACAGHVSANTRPHQLSGWGPLSHAQNAVR